MTNKYSVEIENIKSLSGLKITFDFSTGNVLVITGKNGAGKTTLVKAFKSISEPQVFERTSSLNSIRQNSKISFEINGYQPFTFSYNPKLHGLDTKQTLPPKNTVISELPIPFGDRFQHFTLVAKYDSEIRANIASSNYQFANKLCKFLSDVYPENQRFSKLQVTRVKKYEFYFILKDEDYYIREDHFSSGEFFLIQLFRLITSGAELVIIDELEISLDASAQVHLISALQPLLELFNSKLIVVSHSLAFMKMADEGSLYYLEEDSGVSSLERRSYGYIKSDLYGFRGKDRYIITEDPTLVGFIEYLIRKYKIPVFYQYEVIAVGGEQQVKSITRKNDEHEIFGPSPHVIVIIDKDIAGSLGYKGETQVYTSPVNDIELFIWENRNRLLPEIRLKPFKPADKDKKTAKTYWGKVISSRQKTCDELYQLVIDENNDETIELVDALRNHLCFIN